MIKYKIIQSSSISVFEMKIEKALNDGWELTGNLVLHAAAAGVDDGDDFKVLVFWRELTKNVSRWPLTDTRN